MVVGKKNAAFSQSALPEGDTARNYGKPRLQCWVVWYRRFMREEIAERQ
jgi:hypothetical protein